VVITKVFIMISGDTKVFIMISDDHKGVHYDKW